MKKKIQEIVDRVLKIHSGGEEFFSELDRILAFEIGSEVFEELRSKVPNCYGIILSGKFGKEFARAIDFNKIEFCPYILMEGGIRTGGGVKIIGQYGPRQQKYIFIDDSIYSGKTYLSIKNKMEEKSDFFIESCLAVYDGWPEKRDDVDSIFRFYDEYKTIEI